MGLLDRIASGETVVRQKGEYLVDNAVPVYCAKIARESIAVHIKYLAEEPKNETAEEETLRERLARDYVKVLEVMNEVVDACRRLHYLEYPEEVQEGGADEKAVDSNAVPGGVDYPGDGDSADQEADQAAV